MSLILNFFFYIRNNIIFNYFYPRLVNRLKDDKVYNEGDRSYWSYKPGIIENRLKFTNLKEYGYKSDYYIDNSGDKEDLYNNIDKFINQIKENENTNK